MSSKGYRNIILFAVLQIILCVNCLDAQGYLPYYKDGLVGVIDARTSEVKIPPLFKGVKSFNGDDIFIVASGCENGRSSCKFGLWNVNGKEVLQAEYDAIYPVQDYGFGPEHATETSASYCIIRRDGKIGMVNSRGRMTIPPKYEEIKPFFEGYAAVRKNGKWGYVDDKGRESIRFDFDEAYRFSDGLARICKRKIIKQPIVRDSLGNILEPRSAGFPESGKMEVCLIGYIDWNGFEVIGEQFKESGDFHEGYAWASDGEKFGFIDRKGNWVIPAVYDFVSDFDQGLAYVKRGGKGNVINFLGEVVRSDRNYDGLEPLASQHVKLKVDGRYCVINDNGKEILPPIYDGISAFTDSAFIVKKDGKSGLMNKKGQMILPIDFDFISQYEASGNSCPHIYRDGREACIGPDGKFTTVFYDEIRDMKKGYAQVVSQEKVGLIDSTGKEVIPPLYDEILPFVDGFAKVRKDFNMGLYNQQGKQILPVEYQVIGPYKEGLARVAKSVPGASNLQTLRFGYIDRIGDFRVPLKYEYASDYSEGLAAIKSGKKFGYIDTEGNVRIPFEFSFADDFINEQAMVRMGGKIRIINRIGEVLK